MSEIVMIRQNALYQALTALITLHKYIESHISFRLDLKLNARTIEAMNKNKKFTGTYHNLSTSLFLYLLGLFTAMQKGIDY